MASLPYDAGNGPQPQASGGKGTAPRKITCKHCGCPALLARAHPDAIRARRQRSKVLLLEPWPRPGCGQVVITRDGLAKFSHRFPGDLVTHNCPARISTCKYCGRAVRVLHQPPNAPEQLAVVEAEPDPAGIVMINNHGHAVCDPGFVLPGERFSWHTGHGSSGTVALMREVPRGAR